MEAETHHKLRNQPRSKASLTAARTNANAIYCPPLLQAQIDLMSGTIHGDEKDFDTAFEPPTPTLTLTLTPTLTPNPNPNPNQACVDSLLEAAKQQGLTAGKWMVFVTPAVADAPPP